MCDFLEDLEKEKVYLNNSQVGREYKGTALVKTIAVQRINQAYFSFHLEFFFIFLEI